MCVYGQADRAILTEALNTCKCNVLCPHTNLFHTSLILHSNYFPKQEQQVNVCNGGITVFCGVRTGFQILLRLISGWVNIQQVGKCTLDVTNMERSSHHFMPSESQSMNANT
jgi:hypothetical protein